ncbi:MAG: OsmC/Ohr family protein [Deltaproteobacteria bacterium]|nr:OsmC/Ohr family protein [Deltaproteobacteria bacterium]MBM2837702.1 OsmC/Ohr family protein [Deltaproteobacteria bacterium]
MIDVNVHWTGDMQFVGESVDGHSLVMDADQEHGGRSSGFRPMHLLLVALGGCTGMDVISIMKKKRQEVAALTINIGGEKRVIEDPHVFTRVSVEYVFKGDKLSKAVVERAVKLSEEKYCSVMATLRPLAKIEISWRISEGT